MKFKSLPKAFGTAAVGALIAATCVVANPSAAAADIGGPINYFAPTKATDVRTFKEYVAPSGARLQLRMGKYKGHWYRWARVSKPTSSLNKDYDLHLNRVPTDSSEGCGGFSASSVDIDGTSYTGALRVTYASIPYCKYKAFWRLKDGSAGLKITKILWLGR
ncbi:hypothetical protein [Streptosporangium sp. KLBMP 9127]|nr:hypothetical protein [Streptosporangium sp. KLBMP 9127]